MKIIGKGEEREIALRYPWDPPATSGVIHGGEFLPLRLAMGRRLGLSHQCEDVPDSFSSCSLNRALVEANAATLDSRFLVVSIGSNSSPDVMRRKFASYQKPVSMVFPLIRGRLHNIGVGHSAHVSSAGYIAAAPYFREGARTDVWVAWLDEGQLTALDETEPNYDRIQLSAETCPLELDNAERPDSYCLFTSHWGVLADGLGERLPFMEQRALFRHLARSGDVDGHAPARSLFEGPGEAIVQRLQTTSAQAWAKEWFAAAGLAKRQQFEGVIDAVPPRYGDVASISRPLNPEGLRALAMDDAVDRQGQQCIAVHPDDASALGLEGNALVSALVETSGGSPRPGLMVRVILSSEVDRGTARVDQIVRNALGIERQEYVLVRPAKAPRISRVLGVIGDPSYIVCRVQAADLASVEQQVALIEPLAMRFLGILQGDSIIVEGAQLDEKGDLQPVRLRSLELADTIADRRKSLSGGGFESRFPSSSDALGVFPDLPSIFLDAAIRGKLGLGDSKLGAVRVRASRRYQLLTQLRETLLVVVLAFIGVISIFPGNSLLLAAAIIPIAAWVVIARLRGQLGLRRKASWFAGVRKRRQIGSPPRLPSRGL